jgi:molybdopterin molybdotransferase
VIDIDEALRQIRTRSRPLPAELVPVALAAGRVLAEPVESDTDVPAFLTSAMDGYAVALADCARPEKVLRARSQTVFAGDPPPEPLRGGEAVRVMTGAPVPAGTEAIVPVEHAEGRGDGVVLGEVPAPGAHLRRRGEVIAQGQILLEAGRRLTCRDLAVVAAAGRDPVPVRRRPKVLVAPTGSEVVPASAQPNPGQIRNTNGPMVCGAALQCGALAAEDAIVADRAGALSVWLAHAFDRCDVAITTGGVSAGDADTAVAEAEAAGLEIVFHRVAIRPGKPIAFGVRGDFLWFGLPGNPVSCSVTFELFVRPALALLSGETAPLSRRITARLTAPVRNRGARDIFLDARISVKDGHVLAEPLESRGSHDLASHARANGLIAVAAEAGEIPAGAAVVCVVLADLSEETT